MSTVRLGIIGMGNIGRHHAGYLLDGKVPRCELVAVGSTSPGKLGAYEAKGLKVFGSGEEMIRSGLVDAVLVATPHYQHTWLGIAALDAGIHLMVEKPISAHKADAERLIAAHHRHPRVVFGAMFQLRAEPRYQKIRALLRSGELGELARVSWLITDWYRTEAYYASGGWRATWKGEGGGVLLNQCLHNLDVLAWLLGMPARVRGFCQLGRYHQIEVEDNVTAYLEYPNGATGIFVTSTGEAPGSNRFEIAGTRGRLVLEGGRLTVIRNEVDMLEWSRAAKVGFSKPEIWNVEIPFENAAAPHAEFMKNFVDAILDGAPLMAPGEEGLNSVELANVMLLSSLQERTVELPMDGALYEQKLGQLIRESRVEKQVVEIAGDDFTKSFHR
ncbi:MAG: Gfo/Idh/MocA family oxidoreductase [Verrucomicrobia bacterium]|nr:Gfo/Idh/MocA family oxidoreductase [Verrucomicrobiota bacterium]